MNRSVDPMVEFQEDVEKKENKELQIYKIICLSLLVCLIVVSLGLGLGLGLKHQQSYSTAESCRQRCYTPFDVETGNCRCDSFCKEDGSCCWDFEEVCLQPGQIQHRLSHYGLWVANDLEISSLQPRVPVRKFAQLWTCSKFRCGEERLPQSHCSCSDDCLQAGDCCTDYSSVCKKETRWADDPCEDLTTPKCPAGKADVTPNFKKDNKNDPGTYTPVSLMPIVSTITKSLIKDKIMEHLDRSKIINDSQYEFIMVLGHFSTASGTSLTAHYSFTRPNRFTQPPLILFSLDGFRAEYLHTWYSLMPVINKLKTCGTHSRYMRAMYPTKTFPNHYSIVTGLYPETHGIIDNSMYDINLQMSFNLSGTEKNDPRWWQGQPVWLTAMYEGLKAGTFFWPGSDVKINGSFPNIYKVFNKSIPFEQRVFSILKWLSLPDSERPYLYTIYLEEPDSAGHRFGPVSGGVIEALQNVDRIVGMLMDGLKQRNLHKCVNIIVVADHGMEQTYCDRIEYLTNYLDSVDNLYVFNGPAPRIQTKNVPGDYFTFDSEGIIKNLSCRSPNQHFIPYLSHQLPKRFHYAKNIRINKANLYLDEQWLAGRDKNSFRYCGGGNHGYDNEFRSMDAIFIGQGPGFKFQTEVQPFDNIELYNLMCDLLQITPAPNNGSHGSLNNMLKTPFYTPTFPAEISTPSLCPLYTLTPSDNLGCSCNLSTTLEKINERLNLTADQVQSTEKQNVPYGRPRILQNITHCLLFHESYISGYSDNILMPLWNAYTIFKPETTPLPPAISDCLRADPRVFANSSQKCSNYKADLNISYEFLYSPNLNTSEIGRYDGLITSNIVPMYEAFKIIWRYVHTMLLPRFAVERNGINVMSGPVFDYDFDGHFDIPENISEHVNYTAIPIPTHYYIVITSCKNTTETPLQCEGSLDAMSFILPHRPDNNESCAAGKEESQWVEKRVWMHTARVRDVELITGLDFYQERKQPITEILQLKTFLPEFKPSV